MEITVVLPMITGDGVLFASPSRAGNLTVPLRCRQTTQGKSARPFLPNLETNLQTVKVAGERVSPTRWGRVDVATFWEQDLMGIKSRPGEVTS